jgi:nickel-dependent lactate racemase
MKTVHLPYGKSSIEVELPDSATVVEPTHPPALEDEAGAVVAALHAGHAVPSLSELVKRAKKIVVVFPDLTRPMPNTTVLPPLLAELETLGAGPERVELLCATGTHRRATPDEMKSLIGPETFSRYRFHDHSCTEDEHVVVGEVDGTEIRIDRKYVDADLRIVTGFVEPHFFAGFSGGPKGVCPGLADLDTVLEAHSRRRIADPNATWIEMQHNPVQDFVRRAVGFAPPTLSLDVTIDSRRRLTGVFCGPLPDGHKQACESVMKHSVTSLDHPFEVVVTTNGGFPLDRNLYQVVKGMAAAERVVADKGTIIIASECSDGLPSGGAFQRLLADAKNIDELISGGAALSQEPDGWQTQVLGRVLSKADVWIRSDGLSDSDARIAQLRPVKDIGASIKEALEHHGENSRVCVLVQGPLAVATVRS